MKMDMKCSEKLFREKKILIVEDDIDIRDVLKELLELEGYIVSVAENGKKALEILKNKNKPDLILLDLMMPVMAGLQFKEIQLKNIKIKNIPVIIMSADINFSKNKNNLYKDEFLKKPLDLHDVLNSVSKYFKNA